MTISIHQASLKEKEQANHNSYPTWGKHESRTCYLERCRSSFRRIRAQCWVLTSDEVVVSSLGCLSLKFHVDGDIIHGFGIASVHTRKDMRENGFANTLCQHVIEQHRRSRVQVGLLFSDIGSSYYEKMGFVLHSQDSYDCRSLQTLMKSGPRATLVSIDPVSEITWLQSTYQSFHKHKKLALARDEEYWSYSIQANSRNLFWAIRYNHQRVGYVRVATSEELWAIVECVIPAKQIREEIACDVYRQIAFLAHQVKISWLTCWQHPPRGILRHYTKRTRSKAWPMIMAPQALKLKDLHAAPIYVTDYF